MREDMTEKNRSGEKAVCLQAKKCGGCQYIGVPYEEQLRKGIRYTIDIEALPEEYAEVVKILQKDRELEEIYSTTGDCRIHCIGRSVNTSTMESHVNYLFNHTKGIRKIGWHILLSDLKAGEGSGDGTEKESQ